MKHKGFILLAVVIILVGTVACRYFYVMNVNAMSEQAKMLFTQVLNEEMDRKQGELNLPYSSFGGSDTVRLSVRITTAAGSKLYQVDPEKSKKNISQSRMKRSAHSVTIIFNSLNIDSLHLLWKEHLVNLNINAETGIRCSVIDLCDKVHDTEVFDSKVFSTYPCTYTVYLGDRCEAEVTGFIQFSWIGIVRFHLIPFVLTILVCGVILLLLYYLYRYKYRPVEKEIVEKEVIHETFVQKEVIVPVIVPDKVKASIYQLKPGLLFDPMNQRLLVGEKSIPLAPQSCIILKMFLSAPDYTLHDEEILTIVWGKKTASTIQTFRVASVRLLDCFKEVGYPIRILRFGRDCYRMHLPDNECVDIVVINGNK